MISFKGYSYPKKVILQAVRWYVAYCLSYRDIEELLEDLVSLSTTVLSIAGCCDSRHY